jgi:multidrug transporter EmrE-like cation transporter
MNITLDGITRLWGGWGILIFSTLTGVVAQLALKHGMSGKSLLPAGAKLLDLIPTLLSTWQLWVYGFFAAVSLVSWFFVLNQFDLSMAFPVVQSLSYLLIVVLSVILFKETVSLTNAAGLALLCVGVFLAAQ